MTETLAIDLGGGRMLDMIRIPAGTFRMGSPEDEPDRFPQEGPVHSVTISNDFYLGRFPVTQGQWALIMGGNPSKSAKGEDHPVECVSWVDICGAGGFLGALNRLNPGGWRGFRLPTEAEWEYACRAGTRTVFHWGDDPSRQMVREYAWYSCLSGSTTRPVGLKRPNPFGLHDMSGNVWQWCSDWHGPYSPDAVTDPTGPATGIYRILRGGGCYFDDRYCRSAHRGGSYFPSTRHGDIGFRLALPFGGRGTSPWEPVGNLASRNVDNRGLNSW